MGEFALGICFVLAVWFVIRFEILSDLCGMAWWWLLRRQPTEVKAGELYRRANGEIVRIASDSHRNGKWIGVHYPPFSEKISPEKIDDLRRL